MRTSLHLYILLTFLFMALARQPLCAQPGFDLDIKKPEPYDNRLLKAEKTGDKKLKAPKRFFQNLTTHYNYYFNANNKLNEVILRAKAAHKDDYGNLLPFYNYTLDATAMDAQQLDSVIYKSQTGIVMHDLRNDWMDNMYMLWGAAQFFQKKFDSASLMFQFINYAFAEKEKDGYYRYIGSRMDGGSATNISTKEKEGFVKKVFATSPSRNDAFIWQIRSQIELDNLTEAGSLIVTLKSDPNFPERLTDDLEEVQAYWFYKQERWDSSAAHLVKALNQAQTKSEKARWEYLAAQMFERSGRFETAEELFSKAIAHGTDPVMDVYARLNLVRINKDSSDNYIDRNIAELVKMAKRERFEEYRDVIYYMAAQMELERGNLGAASELLMKAAKANNGNLTSRNKAFLQIADLSYEQKKFIQAAAFYDSVQFRDLTDAEMARINERKPALGRAVTQILVISRQDSLQRIAALPEDERKAYINKLVKQLRKLQGLAEEAAPSAGRAPGSTTTTSPDLFQGQPKGEWYFYNATLKTQGAAQFKQIWGNRPNTDNWRRFSDVSSQLLAKAGTNLRNDPEVATTNEPGSEISYEGLLNKLPLTPETFSTSEDSIKNALFKLGNVYLSDMEDHPLAIETFEKLRSRFPDFLPMDEVLFNLYYSYTKTGDVVKAALIKNMMVQKFPSSKNTTIVTTGKDAGTINPQATAATKDYEAVYDLFIEGRFEEAKAAKKRADSTYQTNQWQPQLLYIEAVYHAKNREDSAAKTILATLIAQSPKAVLAQKAQALIDVLNRRQQIEDELNRLQIERPKDADNRATEITVAKPVIEKPTLLPPKQVAETGVREEETARPSGEKQNAIGGVSKDYSVNTKPNAPVIDPRTGKPSFQQPKSVSVYTHDVATQHFAVVVLNKVDAVFGNETKNAFARYNREKYYNQPLTINNVELDSATKLVMIGPFNNAQEAVDYYAGVKRLAPTEIIPWLKADKYTFLIISPMNFELLQTEKDLVKYRKFLELHLPGKF